MSLEGEIMAQLANSREVEHHLDVLAAQIRDEIKELTPVFGDHPPKRAVPGIGEPGDLRDSIEVSPIKWPHRRRVQSDDPKVYWAELGAKHFPEVGMFAQVIAQHDGTGPVVDADIAAVQKSYRYEAAKLAKEVTLGNVASIAEQRRALARATMQRSAAFDAARRSRSRGRRGRRR